MASHTQASTASASNAAQCIEDNDTFIITLRGIKIPLTRTQIESDTPGSNLFSSSLLGDFIESSSKTMKLDRSPGLFRLIIDHLSGYTILPLDGKVLKEYCGNGMSEERALRYLVDDSEYYGFGRLNALLLDEIERIQDGKESFEDQVLYFKKEKLGLEKERLRVERARLKMDVRKTNEHLYKEDYDRKVEIMKIKLDTDLRRMQYLSAYAGTRQVGSSDYASQKSLLERDISSIISRLDRSINPEIFEDAPNPHELYPPEYEQLSLAELLQEEEFTTPQAGDAGAATEAVDNTANMNE